MSKPKHPLSKSEVTGLVKRFIKPEQYNAKRDIILFYRVFNLFPNPEFWKSYNLGFTLNSIAWFLSEDGKNKLKTDLALFNLDLSSNQDYNIQEAKCGDDIIVSKPKTTISSLFKK